MMTTWKKLSLAGAAGAMALVGGLTATTAQARDHYRGRGDNDAAVAIGAGVLGLIVGAAIADSNDDRYYDSGYYPDRRYVTYPGYPGYYYYYRSRPNIYYRDRYYDRYYGSRYSNRWNRGWDRGYRYGGRGYYRGHDRHERYERRGWRGHDRDDDHGRRWRHR